LLLINEKASEEEKKAEAPKSAKADTGGKGPIKLGDSLPSITLQNEKGEDVDVAKLAEGGKGVVLFLYPKVGSYTTSVGLY
jgi:peroxiredoxin Q/BCP